MSDQLTDYGFTWGPMEVERVASINGYRVVTVKTGHKSVDIYVSPKGRSVRVFEHGKGELKTVTNG